MEKHQTGDELARYICRELYEFTDGWPMEWRTAVGGAWMHAAMEHAVEHGWLLLDDEDDSILPDGRGAARSSQVVVLRVGLRSPATSATAISRVFFRQSML